MLAAVERANQGGELAVITDNLQPRQLLDPGPLAEHPRIRQVIIPVGACWLNLHGAWWRRSRRATLPGQAFGCPGEISLATRVATWQLNARARRWVWRPPRPATALPAPRPLQKERTQQR